MKQVTKLWTIGLFALIAGACQSDKAADQKAAADETNKQEMNQMQTEGISEIEYDPQMISGFDWQAHRGGRGLMPENTLPAFMNSMLFDKVTTIELDVVCSKDRQMIVSHEPWIDADICVNEDGSKVPPKDKVNNSILKMTYTQIRQFDCGSIPNPALPLQKNISISKPTLMSVLRGIQSQCENSGREVPYFNIELKSRPEWYGDFVPQPSDFVTQFLEYLKRIDPTLTSRMSVQSFDPAILEQMYKEAPHIPLVYLVDNKDSLDKNLSRLSFVPQIFSPNHELVDEALVVAVHAENMRLVTWTVNDINRMSELKAMGVDGIITDYPNRIEAVE